MFESLDKLALGLIMGLAFGFLLQKGRVAKFRVIVGQFLLKDWTMVKVMLSAVAVGALGVWLLIGLGLATLHVKPAAFGGVVVGAIIFGCGMALFGYCPGTGVAACGEGRRDAMMGVLGMFCGALAYVAAFPALQGLIKGFGDWGKVTLPQLTGVSPWVFVAAIVVLALLVRIFAERRRVLPS